MKLAAHLANQPVDKMTELLAKLHATGKIKLAVPPDYFVWEGTNAELEELLGLNQSHSPRENGKNEEQRRKTKT
jgi:hypothetical protein